MRRYRTVLACSLSALALAGACIPALATPYNDSSVTGGSEAWNQWVQEWETGRHGLHQGVPDPRRG